MKRFIVLAAAVLLLASGSLLAQDSRNYTEGSVTAVTAVRTHDGQFENYMRYLGDQYKRVMDAQKEAENILDYQIFATIPRSPDDPDIYLTVTYANMAAFDGMQDRMDPVSRRVSGESLDQSERSYGERGEMRRILGTELIRQQILR
ncbi:hypothetical protein [Alkalisalibacterium limincola]|uniref:Uncharacterized protein n=1 Tax=Alkalisalibacterium limincola TaxID=2699169 RepID=A0A5C8KXL3_9GAMM|nr:hypothetical protein [Alkalisalibacterium limincola]TXK64323.1 hypothetical protein FU658_05315 [Alkalisalibacterium limincola]